MEDALAEAVRQGRQLIAAAWAMREAARTRVAAGREAVAGNQVAVRGFTQQQQVGARTLLDVLITQQDLLASEVSEVTAEHDLLAATLQLASATGQLDAANLHLPVAGYDPARHYDRVRNQWIGTSPP